MVLHSKCLKRAFPGINWQEFYFVCQSRGEQNAIDGGHSTPTCRFSPSSPRTDPVEKGSWYRCQNGHQAGSLVSFVLTAFLLQCHTAIDHTLPLFFLPHSYCPLPQVSFLHLCLLLLWDPPCPTEAVCFQPLIASGTADMCACGLCLLDRYGKSGQSLHW